MSLYETVTHKQKNSTTIKEILIIIIGILVALFINNWNKNRKDRNYIELISSSIDRELSNTNEDIKIKIPTQKSIIDTLDYYLNDDKVSLVNVVSKNNGFYMPSIKINSWKSISNSKIELMNYDMISALANVEELKELLKIKSGNFTSFVYSNSNEISAEKKKLMKLMILDIIHTETAIREDIKKILRNNASG